MQVLTCPFSFVVYLFHLLYTLTNVNNFLLHEIVDHGSEIIASSSNLDPFVYLSSIYSMHYESVVFDSNIRP